MDGSEWSYDNLNSICWAIGSISGCLPDQDEKQFLIHAIKSLLTLCEQKRGKENKAVVASNIMYVVGQYPKFLKTNWNFLKTVIKKLFEFMKESFEGVQEMACNTFLTISQKCGKEFVIRQTGTDHVEKEPYIYELIRNIRDQLSILQDQFKLTYYESLGYIISFEEDPNRKVELVISLMKHLSDQFQQNIQQGTQSVEFLKDEKTQSFFIHFLKVSQMIVHPVGFAFQTSLIQCIKCLNELYIFYSNLVLSQIQQQGKIVLNWYSVKKVRQIKREILKLYTAFFLHSNSQDLNQSPLLKEHVILPICTLLKEYSMSINEQKEYELLNLFRTMLEKINIQIVDLVPGILSEVFQSTIVLISSDFHSYPDHRVAFFEFLKASVTHHLSALFNMQQEQFKLMIDCIIWASKHQVPNLQNLGLDLLSYILQHINQNVNVANQFYQLYFMRLLKDILEILTDSLHTSGFKVQAFILQQLFQVAAHPQIPGPLAPEQGPGASNLDFVSLFLIEQLSNAFTNVSRQQTEHHIREMFKNVNNPQLFRRELSDYLINLKQFMNNNEHLREEAKPTSQ